MPGFAYDGTWKGFLCLLERMEALDVSLSPEEPRVRSFRQGENNLFREDELIVTVDAVAWRMHQRLKERLGKREGWTFRHAQAAGKDAIDGLLAKLWVRGSEALTVDERYLLVQWAGRVSFESHRYQGILRLYPLEGGIMYGPLSPEYHILPFLMQWGADRFPETPLLLHDTRRDMFRWNIPGKGSGEGERRDVLELVPDLPEPEELLQRLAGGDDIESDWKHYTEATAVKERSNRKQQRGYLPHKYRAWLPEFR